MSNRFIISLSCCFFFCTYLKAQDQEYQQANLFYEQKEFQAVIQLLDQEEPKLEREYFLLGKAYYQINETDAAIQAFEQCIEIHKENPENHYWLGLSNLKALQKESNFFSKGLYAIKVQAALKRAIELSPGHLEARIQLANYYLNAPLIAGGSTTRAKEQALAIKDFDPAKGRILMAAIHMHNEEYDEAEKLFLESISKNENTEKVYYQLAVIMLKKQDYKSAFEFLETSLNEFPEYKMPHYQYGKTSAISSMNLEEGKCHLNTYIDLQQSSNLPSDHWAYYRLGQIYLLQENKIEAAKAFRKSLELKADFEQSKAELKNLE